MDNSPFGKMPAELRRILELALYQQDGLFIDRNSHGRPQLRNMRHPLALLHACRATYMECRTMFYAINTFHLANGGEYCISWDFDTFKKQREPGMLHGLFGMFVYQEAGWLIRRAYNVWLPGRRSVTLSYKGVGSHSHKSS